MRLPKDLAHPLAPAIEKCAYLRTLEILPVIGSILEFHAGDAVAQGDPHSVAGIKDVRSIEVPSGADCFAFKFTNFLTYAVTDEMFAQHGPNEIFEGGRLRYYSKSHFLDFVSSTTWANAEFPGEILHYQLNTLDHTIDVATVEPPELVIHKQDQL